MNVSRTGQLRPIDQFTRSARLASNSVIRSYSTSFGLAVTLLGRRHRQHIRSIYAFVRVADEIVDGVCEDAGLDAAHQRAILTRYRDDAYRAIRDGYSPDVVLHAFAHTARRCGIDHTLIDPFFTSMSRDIVGDSDNGSNPENSPSQTWNEQDYRSYVYGSAEVVGLMCLRVFTHNGTYTPAHMELLEHGARALGAAFQNVNFLRDLADDTTRLQRNYLSATGQLTNQDRDQWVHLIESQLRQADQAISLLPRDCHMAVRIARDCFAALNQRLARIDVTELYRRRLRISNVHKLAITARAIGSTVTAWLRPKRDGGSQ